MGFTGPALDIALGVSRAESGGYSDAVGDVSLVNDKWGPSIGLFQIRSLRHPGDYLYPDTLRVASDLRDPVKNAAAAYAISKKGTVWTPWSVFNSGSYQQYASKDYTIKTGHSRAGDWDK